MSQSMFSGEVELGGFLGSIDVIPDVFCAILETSLSYEFHTSSSGIKILAFNCSADDTTRFLNGEFKLVSSVNLPAVDFIPTKVNPSFFINETAVHLFESLFVELKERENQLIFKPLVVTGWSLGGYIAILFTLWLHHAIDDKESNGSKGTKRPICITFGSPLVGDEALQRAISERPQWKSSFLNVVAKTDPIASVFSSKSPYKPFGIFLFCTESGGHTTFEDQQAVLAVLDAMESSRAGNLEMPQSIRRKDMPDYGSHLKSMRRKVLYRGVSELAKVDSDALMACIKWQFREIGMRDDHIPKDLIERMKVKQQNMIKRKKNAYEPTKKLNENKITLTYMEWYKKTREPNGGYYDSYKSPQSRDEILKHQEIVRHQRSLNQYWEEIVEENNRMPQKEGANLRKRWLYAGNNYRRIVEPLDIAEYYKNGNRDYATNRPNRYKLLEKWSNEDKKDLSPTGRKKKAASLTEDSCFWAHVENALISLEDLKNGGSSSKADDMKQKLEQHLKEFETYVMDAINNYSVSSEIFLKGSCFMKWWSDYEKHKGSSYASESELARFMNNGGDRSYQ